MVFFDVKIKERRIGNMDQKLYIFVNKFNCCEKYTVTVIIKNKVICIISKWEDNRIIVRQNGKTGRKADWREKGHVLWINF